MREVEYTNEKTMNIKNKYNLPRGTICVARMVNGELVALRIVYPVWQAYQGAFSIL